MDFKFNYSRTTVFGYLNNQRRVNAVTLFHSIGWFYNQISYISKYAVIYAYVSIACINMMLPKRHGVYTTMFAVYNFYAKFIRTDTWRRRRRWFKKQATLMEICSLFSEFVLLWCLHSCLMLRLFSFHFNSIQCRLLNPAESSPPREKCLSSALCFGWLPNRCTLLRHQYFELFGEDDSTKLKKLFPLLHLFPWSVNFAIVFKTSNMTQITSIDSHFWGLNLVTRKVNFHILYQVLETTEKHE